MISRAQQILVKRAQREAGLDDLEYRDALEVVSGCRSTTDPRLTDRHIDLVLGYFEAIHFRKVDSGELKPSCKADAVFRQRGYWAQKNTRQDNSRTRYALTSVMREVSQTEQALARLGFGPAYCAGIRSHVTQGRDDALSIHKYKAALERTLRAKQKKISAELVSAAPSKT